ncbi:MAG: glycoside hydrolase family 9 protein, partial [Ruminococcus sp.]
DRNFADTCLAAAERAWACLEENPNLIFEDPEDITTGAYQDTSDKDERYWAAAQLYRATGSETYRNALESMTVKTGLDWATVGDYGNIAILTMDNIDTNSTAYTNAKNALIKQADSFVTTTTKNPYGVAVSVFNWGSNMTVANAGIVLGLAYQLTENTEYLTAAKSNLHYLLGNNPVGECFVTGYGTVSPQNPHHRPSMAKNQAMKGMLVGGVNSHLEDPAAKAYLATTADAKCYVDHSESYSTNEITIYWNSPLTYLLSLTNTGSSSSAFQKGDVNQDGSVTVADVVLLQKYLIRKATLTAEQGIYADLHEDSAVNVIDLCVLKKKLLSNSNSNPGQDPNTDQQPNINATMYANFREGAVKEFFASDGWSNGSCFDCVWRGSNATFQDSALNLTIDKDTSGQYNYSGAEYRTTDFYSYGYYETSMQAIKNDGVVSSFFTYTGPSDNNPWDEIDVEILGKDTTKVQFNYYTNGTGNHEYMYDLGFDASTGYHTYGFDWQKDSITWYVDGKAVYTATQDIPSTPGKIMMNVWPGTGVDAWLKPYDGTTPLTAKYQWVTYNESGRN